MLCAALRGDSPVVLLENRGLYEIEDEVSEEATPIPFGRGRIVREGTDITIVGASLMAYEAARAADLLAEYGVSAEVIDPRSIRPLDERIILASLRKTGRLVVADTSWAMCGFAAEVAALAAEKGHAFLRAPVRRVTPPDCPAPVSKPLEDAFHPTPLTILRACTEVLNLGASVDRIITDVQARFAGPY
jgi:pyruvate dehydrogenase E1 component beta subunit